MDVQCTFKLVAIGMLISAAFPDALRITSSFNGMFTNPSRHTINLNNYFWMQKSKYFNWGWGGVGGAVTFHACLLWITCTTYFFQQICTEMHPVVGNTSDNIHLSCNVTGRPCCVGIQAICLITSQEHCEYIGGTFHPDAFLCSQVKERGREKYM